jgi:hypothetical protein
MPLGDSVVAQNYILMTAMLQAVTQKARASVAAYGPALADYLSLFQRDFRAKCDTALYREEKQSLTVSTHWRSGGSFFSSVTHITHTQTFNLRDSKM